MGRDKPRKKDSARLVWDSKPRRAPNPRDIEFQTAEIVIPNPQRDSAQIPFSFREGRLGEGELDKTKMNRLIWGDNLLAMQALLAQGYEGKIDLIYIDPPFDSKADYSYRLSIEGEEITKEPSIIERLAYKDTWEGGTDSYLDMLYPRLHLMKRLLSPKGSIFVHIGPGVSSYVKNILDEIFGKDRFLNEIVWQRRLGQTQSQRKRFGTVTDSIFWFSKTEDYTFCPQFTKEGAEEYVQERYVRVTPDGRRYKLDNLGNPGYRPTLRYTYKGFPPPKKGWAVSLETMERMDREGRIEYPTKPGGKLMRRQFLDQWLGKPIQSLWDDIPPINSQANERLGFETQKPEALVERVILATLGESAPGRESIPIVADFFCGSGTTMAVAERLGYRWIGSDLGKVCVQLARIRLVQKDAKPFLCENIGNYQREMIYLGGARIHEMMAIVLKLYGATLRKGTPELGTRKAPDDIIELVYVGYPDRPTTAKKVEELARTAEKLDGTGYKRLVVLAWDYDYNFSTELEKRLKSSSQKIKAKIELRTIPPEIYEYLKKAKEEDEIEPLRGKIRFYEKPYLKLDRPEVGKSQNGQVPVKIKIRRYVIFDIPVEKEEEKEKLRQIAKGNFPVLIDYWAVDWNYDGLTFKSQWQDFRGHGRQAKIVKTQAETELTAGKTYAIAVRVVDIFGNDAAGTVEVDLR
jgi:adenine-specific DNA-methyltransferase